MSVDTDRLEQARHVITGGAHEGESNALYAVYVAVIAALSYGVPASQQFFRFLDPRWLADHLTGVRGVVLAVVAVAALLVLVSRVARVRGPVVPDLPYLDHVATSPLDRAVVLRRWWRLGLVGCLVAGVLSGLVLGAGLAIAGVTGALVLVPGALGGALLGLLTAGTWLHAQVRSWPTGDRGPAAFLRERRSLRALHLTGLRVQSARSVTIGGAVLAGDLRAARLDIGSPTTRGRRVRLRPRGPVGVIVARDVLGLRRAPGALATGLVASGLAAYGLVHGSAPSVPSFVAFASLVVGYLGVGVLAEGMRLQGDNAGTPPILGIDARREAQAHLVVPAVLYAVVTLVVAAVSVSALGASVRGLVWALLMTGLLVTAHLMAAFRGLPPISAFGPGRGVASTALWYGRPLIVTLIGGTVATAFVTAGAPGNGVLLLLAVTWGTALFGMRAVRLLDEAHRG